MNEPQQRRRWPFRTPEIGRIEEKSSTLETLFALTGVAEPLWTASNYAALASEGYERNPIVYRSVRMIAEAASTVEFYNRSDEANGERHPVLELVCSPNASQSGAELLDTLFSHLMVSGNAYLELVREGSRPVALHCLRPDRISAVAGHEGWPSHYDYIVDGKVSRLEAESNTGPAQVMQLKLFAPRDDYHGLSPLAAAAQSLDIHNASATWSKALLDNAARPSGALVYSAERGNLTDAQFSRLKEELRENFQGAINAGRPLLLEGGLDWKTMSMSPRDLDFIEAKDRAAREIALAFGVPPMLLGLPGDNTYSNYKEANRAFWRQTVMPLVNKFATALSTWLGPAYGETLQIQANIDKIEALAPDRDALWSRVMASDVLTANEKREAIGYSPLEGGDKALFQAKSDGGANE